VWYICFNLPPDFVIQGKSRLFKETAMLVARLMVSLFLGAALITTAAAESNNAKTCRSEPEDLNAQDVRQILSSLSAQIDQNPKSARLYLDRGGCELWFASFERAKVDLDMAINLAPAFAEAYMNRGRLHVALQEYEAAIADFTRSAELAPTVAVPLNKRGITYIKLGLFDLGLNDLKKAMSMDGKDESSLLFGALALALLGRLDEAEKIFDDLERLNPNDKSTGEILLARSIIRCKLGLSQQCEDDYKQAIEINPKLVDAPRDIEFLYYVARKPMVRTGVPWIR
jgi:tetratricopeptide (TPR) repeat protein